MSKSKKYFYDYEDYEDGDKDVNTLAEEILNDAELPTLSEIIVGCWGECYDDSVQPLLDKIAENSEKFSHIEHFFIGDMTYEECEVSWIIQGRYDAFLKALPNLKRLTIKGSAELVLGDISHPNLEILEIICGGLPAEALTAIANADLPNLKKLNLYLGVEDYGFDGDLKDIKALLENKSFEALTSLGLGNSAMQDEVVDVVLESPLLSQLKVLDFSNGTLSDKGGAALVQNADKLKHLLKLDLHHHYMSDDMMAQLKGLGIPVNLDDQNENDEAYGNYPMLTE